MSMYGDSPYTNEKNDIYDEILRFLETHPASELMQIIGDVLERKEYENS